MTMPIVLPNGKLLTTNGLDRKRKIYFHIEPEIIELMRMPKGATEKAMRFLINEWLIDVSADFSGKCILIALALTVLERELLGERPALVTAGKRGGGKTTVINMIALALTGKRAPAAARSPNEEERRKAIFAALMQNIPLICWDNIKLGTAISCPTIEKVLTSTDLQDRVLGESRDERVSCSAILTFTGNNITAKGDLASRCLVARINIDRPDPENREFKHPDPFGWTLDHRGEIIKALYTILLGNPRLWKRSKDRSPPKTRFKQCWHLVGSAVEFSAGLCNNPIDFSQLFLTAEADDEDASSLADVLQCLDEVGEKIFVSAQITDTGGPEIRVHFTHRLAFLYMTGRWPTGCIDHIDGNPTNNRWTNLREATHAQNAMNKAIPRNSSSGFKGVFFKKEKWCASITIKGRKKYLGCYRSPHLAHIVYMCHAALAHGKFARLA